MDIDPGETSPPHIESRRARRALAAQACETCRVRKSKCDEKRPKCSLCTRLNLECRYREAPPMKKDQTATHILRLLERMDRKLDELALTVSSPNSRAVRTQEWEPPRKSRSYESMQQQHQQQHHIPSGPSTVAPAQESSASQSDTQDIKKLPGTHRTLFWPAIYNRFLSGGKRAAEGLRHIRDDGTAWLIQKEQQKHPEPLPDDCKLRFYPMSSPRSRDDHPRVGFYELKREAMVAYAAQYFNTFNMLYPLLDYNIFITQFIPKVAEEGFGDSCLVSIIALLVFALGKLAIEGTFGRSIAVVDGEPSGIHGGSAKVPPALDIFNEARRRVGYVMGSCTLENAQILLLTAIYHEASSRHIDCWRLTVMASQAMHIVLRRHPPWDSIEGDMVKRVYWTCNIIEGWYRVDLDLPETGLAGKQDEIPLPVFPENDGSLAGSDQHNEFQYNFLAMIAIRRLIDRINELLYTESDWEVSWPYVGPSIFIVKELARQLEEWRLMLPETLGWTDEGRTSYLWFDGESGAGAATLDAQQLDVTSDRAVNKGQYTTDSSEAKVIHSYNADIINAQLRSRFYYCRFLIYRVFVYKILHHPSQFSEPLDVSKSSQSTYTYHSVAEPISAQDLEFARLCLDSTLFWPVAMSPTRHKKRLIPNMYVWTQSFISMLLVMRAARGNAVLRQVGESVPGGWNALNASEEVMIRWMKEMSNVDGVAEWGWEILQASPRGGSAGESASGEAEEPNLHGWMNEQRDPLNEEDTGPVLTLAGATTGDDRMSD